jgi:HK97 gp10 family phage protein
MSEVAVVTGLDDVLQMLDELPREIVGRAWLKALLAGAKVIQEYLTSATPEYEGPRDEDIPHLGDSIEIKVLLDSQLRGGQALVGFGSKVAHIAFWVEFGHYLVGHEPNKKILKLMPPNPFMRRAADAAYEATVQAFQDALVATLTGEVPGFEATFAAAGGAVNWFPS